MWPRKYISDFRILTKKIVRIRKAYAVFGS